MKVSAKNRNGDCYYIAGKIILDNVFNEKIDNPILVHGEVTGQGSIAGIQYSHAWIEDGDTVIDRSNNRDIKLPAVFYYALGNINKRKTCRYTEKEAREKMLEFKHYGPWD